MLAEPTRVEAETSGPIMSVAGRLGGGILGEWDEIRHTAAVIGTVFVASVQPRSWTPAVRMALARQMHANAIEPLWFVASIGVFVGISVVMQLTLWTGEAGQSQVLGSLLVTVVARELGPVLINLVVIVRGGSTMTTELGIMKASGHVATLEEQGGDPFLQLVMPRVLATAISTFCLTVVFIAVAFASGFVFAGWMGQGSRDPLLFADTISAAMGPKDALNILAKCVLPALFASASYCIGGLGVGREIAEVPDATQRALTRSVAGLFFISVVVSLLTYL
ncbi:MAG TPA: ABC transporter permease [Opitutaceae bacterium]|nr:ABC transporter permease [Opitutaceae bacterium]